MLINQKNKGIIKIVLSLITVVAIVIGIAVLSSYLSGGFNKDLLQLDYSFNKVIIKTALKNVVKYRQTINNRFLSSVLLTFVINCIPFIQQSK